MVRDPLVELKDILSKCDNSVEGLALRRYYKELFRLLMRTKQMVEDLADGADIAEAIRVVREANLSVFFACSISDDKTLYEDFRYHLYLAGDSCVVIQGDSDDCPDVEIATDPVVLDYVDEDAL